MSSCKKGPHSPNLDYIYTLLVPLKISYYTVQHYPPPPGPEYLSLNNSWHSNSVDQLLYWLHMFVTGSGLAGHCHH